MFQRIKTIIFIGLISVAARNSQAATSAENSSINDSAFHLGVGGETALGLPYLGLSTDFGKHFRADVALGFLLVQPLSMGVGLKVMGAQSWSVRPYLGIALNYTTICIFDCTQIMGLATSGGLVFNAATFEIGLGLGYLNDITPFSEGSTVTYSLGLGFKY